MFQIVARVTVTRTTTPTRLLRAGSASTTSPSLRKGDQQAVDRRRSRLRTTFSPFVQTEDICRAGGVSYVYAFDYMCRRWPVGYNPFGDMVMQTIPANSSGSSIVGVKVSLGVGVASQPVLSSTGDYLIIQNSQGGFASGAAPEVDPPDRLLSSCL